MIRFASASRACPSRKPRASGDDPRIAKQKAEAEEVNPARAGMIRPQGNSPTKKGSKPRASGDDPCPYGNSHECPS